MQKVFVRRCSDLCSTTFARLRVRLAFLPSCLLRSKEPFRQEDDATSTETTSQLPSNDATGAISLTAHRASRSRYRLRTPQRIVKGQDLFLIFLREARGYFPFCQIDRSTATSNPCQPSRQHSIDEQQVAAKRSKANDRRVTLGLA